MMPHPATHVRPGGRPAAAPRRRGRRAACDDPAIDARPTSTDVARRAGVSQSAVSLTLSGKAEGRISAATQEAVRRAAAELGYRPNQAARALRTGATRTIGLVVPDGTNPFFGRLLRGAQLAAREEGFTVAMIDAGRERSWEVESIEALQAGPADGLLLYGIEPPAGEAGGPVVLMDVEHRTLPSVALDHHEGARLVGEHLRGLGHERVGHLHSSYRRPFFDARDAGLVEGLGHAPVREPSRFAIAPAREAAHALLEREPGLTALACDDDVIAAGALIALRERGRRVPADVSLAGFDDLDHAVALAPPLTTVAVHPERLGATAFGVLHRRLAGRRTPRRTTIDVDLVVRASTGPPPG
jgi:LacI family transcriptional regulator, repressor for deo operon, udp, cdd, tsx, nupC, and nupG